MKSRRSIIGKPMMTMCVVFLASVFGMTVSFSQFSMSPHQEVAGKLGFSPDIGRKFLAGVEAGLLRDVHVVLAERSGQLVLESYGVGEDESWGDSIGTVSFDGDTLHDLRSVTKSIVGLLYGIALDKGLVPPLDTPVLSQFPEYTDLAADPERQKRTIKHALTMTLAMEWDESAPYTSAKNSEIAMELADDRFRFILDRPLTGEPGTQWTYSGGAVALVGEILERGTGKTLPEFAQEALFAPLGITEFEWHAGDDGVASPASGLRLKAGDLLKIGRLVLNKGQWDGTQVISRDWVEASITPQAETDQGLGYGYLWWLGKIPVHTVDRRVGWAAGFGNGGQRLFVSPEADVAAVIYSGNYNDRNAWVTPGRIWGEIILANLLDL